MQKQPPAASPLQPVPAASTATGEGMGQVFRSRDTAGYIALRGFDGTLGGSGQEVDVKTGGGQRVNEAAGEKLDLAPVMDTDCMDT